MGQQAINGAGAERRGKRAEKVGAAAMAATAALMGVVGTHGSVFSCELSHSFHQMQDAGLHTAEVG